MSHTTTVKTVPITSVSALRAAVESLRRRGVNCELLQDAKPRMYYDDQLQKHLGKGNEICPWVLRLADAAYDVGFVPAETGAGLTPVFDDYQPYHGGKAIKEVLGQPWAGEVEHWSGQRDDTEQTLHSIGMLLQDYTLASVCEFAAESGFALGSTTTDEKGNLVVEISVD